MAISKMKKLVLAALREDADKLIDKLTWAGCLEISDLSAGQKDAEAESSASSSSLDTLFREDDLFSPARRGAELAEASLRKTRFLAALEAASPYAPAPKGLFAKKASSSKDLYDSPEDALQSALELADSILSAEERKKEAAAARTAAEAEREALVPWLKTSFPAGPAGTEHTRFFKGCLPLAVEDGRLDAALAAAFESEAYPVYWEEVSRDKTKRYLAGAAEKEAAESAGRVLAELGFVKITFDAEDGESFSSLWEKAGEKAGKATALSERAVEELRTLAERQAELELALDLNETKTVRLEAAERLMLSGHALFLTGWVPEKAIGRLEEIFSSFLCCYAFSDPEGGESVPVLLDNKKLFTPFESVVEMYSLPLYGSFDPTPILSLFYFVIFGLMFGDVIYGLLLTVGCFWAAAKLDLAKGARQMVQMFGICGISCIVSGVLFGGYLGNFPGQLVEALTGEPFSVPGIDLLSTDGIFFFIFASLAVGALQILTALGIKFYTLWRSGERFAALFDVGSWYVIFAGIALLAAVNTTAGAVVAGVGAVMRVATAGRHNKNIFAKVGGGLLGLYGIVGFASDLISYMRIMALGLSSTVIAYVVNVMATLLISPGFSFGSLVGWIVLPVILAGGHLLNFALSVLGCFVHDGRLQYIEFFGRFYEDGGRSFEPLRPVARFTHIDYGD